MRVPQVENVVRRVLAVSPERVEGSSEGVVLGTPPTESRVHPAGGDERLSGKDVAHGGKDVDEPAAVLVVDGVGVWRRREPETGSNGDDFEEGVRRWKRQPVKGSGRERTMTGCTGLALNLQSGDNLFRMTLACR